MSFINKSKKIIAPKKPQARGGGGNSLNSATPSSAEHTASPAPPASLPHPPAAPEPSRAHSAQPSVGIGIVTKPLVTRVTPTRDDVATSSLSRESPSQTGRAPSPAGRVTRSPSVPPSPAHARPAARRGSGIPISMPGASRTTTRTTSPEAFRIEPPSSRREPSRAPSEDRGSKRRRPSSEAQARATPQPSVTATVTTAVASTSTSTPAIPPSPSIQITTPSGETQPASESPPLVEDSSTSTAATKEKGKGKAKATPKPRKRKRNDNAPANGDQPTAGEAGSGDGTPAADGAEPSPKKKRGRKPKSTPANAELLEIEPAIVKMTDLCRDTFIGKKSKLYEEIEKIDWLAVVKKQRARKAEIEARRAAGEDVALETVEQRLDRLGREKAALSGGGGGGQGMMLAPQMRMVNGQLVLDESTLQVDRRERDADIDGPLEIIEESNLTRRVNSATWSKREKTERWDDEETDKFYEALGMFGTDFEMMSKIFPGRTRRMLKNKFVVEERRYPKRVTKALNTRIKVDMGEYSRLAAREFREIDWVEDQLRKVREEHAKTEEAQKAESNVIAKERNEAALAELEKAANGEVDLNAEEKPHKRQRKGKKKFVSKQGGDDAAVVVGTLEDFRAGLGL